MRINWFSPLPPARTAIANYTAALLPKLAERVEVTLWTDQSEWAPSLENHARVRSITQNIPWTEVNQADLSFYNLGNNGAFHAAIWKASCQSPGIVVLHDYCLQSLFLHCFTTQHSSPIEYVHHMERYYGIEGRVAAQTRLDGYESLDFISRYPLTPLALIGSMGAVVHVSSHLESLRGVGPPIRFGALPHSGDYVSKPPPWEPPYRVIIFGFLGENRRLPAVLEALARMPERHSFRLDIYGNILNSREIQGLVASLNLDQLVSIHGYVPEETLHAALLRAHLAINLRLPTMGEASASQLKIWQYGLPSIVTASGWYASLSEEEVALVRPDWEILDIQKHLRLFLQDPERFAQLGAAGQRRLREQHSIESYVDMLLSFVADRDALSNAFLMARNVDRAGAEIGRWSQPSDPADVYRRLARAIADLTGE
jgi:glycosyltransferase involved in cell wall biosynthesis